MSRERSIAEPPADAAATLDATKGWWFRPSHPEARARPRSLTDGIRTYYQHTWKDYRGVWMGKHERAIHFGYYPPGTHRHRDSLTAANDLLLDAAGVTAGSRCLDAGCGVGGTAMYAAETRGAFVAGVTIVREQAARFGRYAEERGVRQAVPVTADFNRLPFPDDCFDAVVVQEALCHAADKARVLDELLRVIRPGGTLAGLEYYVDDPGAPRSSELGRWLDGWFMPALVSPVDFVAAADRIGGTLHFEDLSGAFEPSFRRLYALCRTSYPVQALLYRLRLRSGVQLGNTTASMALWRTFTRREWSYGLFTVTVPPG